LRIFVDNVAKAFLFLERRFKTLILQAEKDALFSGCASFTCMAGRQIASFLYNALTFEAFCTLFQSGSSMKTVLRCLSLFFILGLAGPPSAGASPLPSTLNYQGRLRLTGGASIPDGTGNTLVFRIYTQASGGSDIWNETWNSGTSNVATKDGLFNVVLGTYNPLIIPFDQPYWLGVQVNGDAEMAPRQPLTMAPYAFRAHNLELPLSQALDLGGQPAVDVNNTSSSAAGMGVRGLGYTGVLGSSTASGGTGVVAQQGSGSLAFHAVGLSLFDAPATFSNGAIFNSGTVDFSGATLVGLPATTAPLSLTSSTSVSALNAANSAGATAIYASSSGALPTGSFVNGGGEALEVQGNAVGLSASAANGVAVYGINNGGGGFIPTAQFLAQGTNHAVEGRNTANGALGILGGEDFSGQTGVYGVATAGSAKGVYGKSAQGTGVRGEGQIGVAGVVTGTGQTGVLADGGGFAGSQALQVIGGSQFSGGSVSFTSHVDFSGATVTNFPSQPLVAPLNLSGTGAYDTIYAFNSNAAGSGIEGNLNSSFGTGHGVIGRNNGFNNTGAGVFGANSSATGYGMIAQNSGAGSTTVGLSASANSGTGIYAQGKNALKAVVSAPSGVALQGDWNGQAGAMALKVSGPARFDMGSVTFVSHVDFSGATITGWNLTPNVVAPLNLGANTAQFVLSVSNVGNGEAIRAWGYGTGPAISASAATDAILGYAQGNGAYAGVRGIAGDLAQFGVAGDASGSNKLAGIFGTVGAAGFPVLPGNGTSGVVGASNVANGTGVAGMATCVGCVGVWASGDLAGISATAAAPGGSAVFGTTAGSLARAVVGYSTGNGPAAAGVYAKNTGAGARALVADGNGMGISATASSATGIALFASAPIAISSSGSVQFNGAGRSVSFGTHVDFSGATVTGWNVPALVVAPLNLTQTGSPAAIYANYQSTAGIGTYLRATGTTATVLVVEGGAVGLSATAVNGANRTAVLGQINGGANGAGVKGLDTGAVGQGVMGQGDNAVGVLGSSTNSIGVEGIGQVAGVLAEAMGPGGIALTADWNGQGGAMAMNVSGPARFAMGSVTFNSHVDFSGATITGWNVPALVVAPLSLTLASATAAPLFLNNNGGGTAVSVTANGTGFNLATVHSVATAAGGVGIYSKGEMAVYAEATTSYGVYASNAAGGGISAIYGQNDGIGVNPVGIRAQAGNSGTSIGVLGVATNAAVTYPGTNVGVMGYAQNGSGVRGVADNANAYGVSGHNTITSSNGYGVLGTITSTNSNGAGVVGSTTVGFPAPGASTAIYGFNNVAAGTGVLGVGSTGIGGSFQGLTGVVASGTSVGISATASNGNGVALFASAPIAISSSGNVQFNGVGRSVSFGTHVDFSGATVTGWNVPVVVAAPLNLTLSSGVLAPFSAGNLGAGPGVSATSGGLALVAQGGATGALVQGTSSAITVVGLSATANNSNFGGTSAIGLYGNAVGAAPVNKFGVYGEGGVGTGVYGNGGTGVIGNGTTGVRGMGTTYGVYGDGGASYGVWGQSSAGVATVGGVNGSNSAGGPGVYGTSTSGNGVYGSVGVGSGNGVRGESSGTGAAVFGQQFNTGSGVQGQSNNGAGVKGVGNPGVDGTTFALGGAAVRGTDSSGSVTSTGVIGTSAAGTGVMGQGPTGVYGLGSGAGGIGVFAQQGSGSQALRVQGDALFGPGSVSFSSHVDFSGATVTGWNLPANVVAPLSLTNASGSVATLFANNQAASNGRAIVAKAGAIGIGVSTEGNAFGLSATSGSTAGWFQAPTAVLANGSTVGVSASASGAGSPAIYASSTDFAGIGLKAENSSTNAAIFSSNSGSGPGLQVSGASVGLTATVTNGIAVYGRNNGGGGFKPTGLFETQNTNHAVEGRNTNSGSVGTLGGDLGNGFTGVYGLANNGGTKGVWGQAPAGTGVYGSGLTGVAGVVTATGQIGVLADAQGNTGSLALKVNGPANFIGGPMTFNSLVDFSGATVTGLSTTLTLPFSGTANAAAPAAVFQVTNSGTGFGIRGTATQPGVFGTGFLDSTLTSGVYGVSSASISAGVIGMSLDPSPSNAGVIAISVNGSGVIGQSYGAGGNGGKFQADSGTAVVAQGLNGINATANFTSGTAIRASTNNASDRLALDVSGAAKFTAVGGSPTSQVDFFTDVAFHGNVTGLPGGGGGVPLILSGALMSPILQVTNTNTGGGDGASIISQNGYGLNVTGNFVGLNVSATSGSSNAIYAQNTSNLGTVLANQGGSGPAFRGQAPSMGMDLSVGGGGGATTGVQAFVSSTASFNPATGGLFHVESYGFNADARGEDISAITHGGGNALGVYSSATAVSAAATAIRGESHSGAFSYGAGVYGSADTVNAYGMDAYNTAGVGLRAYGASYAIEADNDINANSHYIRNLQYPVFSGDAASKQYVDDHAVSNPLVLTGTAGGAIISGTNSNIAGGYGLYGAASGSSNTATGVYATNNSTFGYALQAVNTSPSNGATGIYASGNTAITAQGISIGLSATTNNGAGFGIFATNTGAAGNGNAILAYDSSSTGVAIAGANASSSGNSVGVLGQTNSNAGFGVAGFTPGGNTYSAIGAGTYGYSGNGTQAGVLGNGPSFVGVYGQGQQGVIAAGASIGLSATASSATTGIAVYARGKNTQSNSGTIFSQNDAVGGQMSAIFGLTASGIGVVGSNSSAPTLPITSAGVAGYNTSGYGIWGKSTGAASGQPGVWGENTAGASSVGVVGTTMVGPSFPAAAVGVAGFSGFGGIGVLGKILSYGSLSQGILGTVNGNNAVVDGSAGVAAANSNVSASNGSPSIALDIDGAISMNTTRTDRSAGSITVGMVAGSNTIGFSNGTATISSPSIRSTNCLIYLTVVDNNYSADTVITARVQTLSPGNANILVSALWSKNTPPGATSVTVNYLIINTR
jgi:hypothetical protein